MHVTFVAYLAFDDNTPAHLPPFTHDPCVWSLVEDYGLSCCFDPAFFAALGYPWAELGHTTDEDFGEPLVPLRGAPTFLGEVSEARELLDTEEYVGWLSADELVAAINHASIDETTLARPFQVLLGAIRYLASVYGENRVRLLFLFL
ncbi:MAG: hypothetical protein DWQ37_15235 [Planctomycetota bacterium]|nr:MAG: hypothetical protein DWQ37_15235 [Planctomycetota bacterium]